jgi:hypothetical protein
MSFAPKEIETMLADYETDHHTGMDQAAIAERIYYYTSGYPFMVSAICKEMDEKGKIWNSESIDDIAKDFSSEKNTLFGSLAKNLQNNDEFASVAKRLVLYGAKINNMVDNPSIERGLVLNIFNEDRYQNVRVSNRIFETRIANYFISRLETSTKKSFGPYNQERSGFIENGALNMEYILQRFNVFMKSEYRDRDSAFIEREARLVFLAFLKPIINGEGNYAVEPETRNNQRMDIVVFWHGAEYIIELKIWRGESYEAKGMEQLAEYLKGKSRKRGWLLSFANLQKSPREGGLHTIDGVEI